MKTREWLFYAASSLMTVPAASVAKKTENLGPLLVRLDLRGFSITIAASGRGNRYTVDQREGGARIAENATLEDLRKETPEVYELVKDAMVLAQGVVELKS